MRYLILGILEIVGLVLIGYYSFWQVALGVWLIHIVNSRLTDLKIARETRI